MVPVEPSQPPSTPEELIAQVHGGRMGHHGARKTWKLLNEHFPDAHQERGGDSARAVPLLRTVGVYEFLISDPDSDLMSL